MRPYFSLFILLFTTIFHGVYAAGRPTGISLGTVYDTRIEGVSPYLQINDGMFSMGFGTLSTNMEEKIKKCVHEFPSSSEDYTNYLAHLGVRQKVFSNFFGQVGASGVYRKAKGDLNNTYTYGPYGGVELYFLKFIMLTGQVMVPVTFDRSEQAFHKKDGKYSPEYQVGISLAF